MSKEGAIVDQEDQIIGGGFTKEEDIHDALPDFLKEDKLKDKHGRRPDHPEYDATSLYVPAAFMK